MKKIFVLLISLIVSLALAACGNKTTQAPTGTTTGSNQTTTQTETQSNDKIPVISGAQDVTLTVGDRYRPVAGLTATDYKGNDITDFINYSGNVDTSVAGTYPVTFSVTDEEGNTASVNITVTVTKSDKVGPMITGAGNTTVVVTDEFDPLEGVNANDTVDGDVTSKIVVEGTVNTKVLGEYTLTYKVQDESGNESTAERKVTVNTGKFIFDENDLMEGTSKVDATMEDINGLYEFGVVKVFFTTTNAGEATIKFGDYTVTCATVAGDNEAYVKYTGDVSNQDIEITGGNLTGYIVGGCPDIVYPELTGKFDQAFTLSKTNKELALQIVLELSGAIASDDTDGNVTSRITLDTDSINWDSIDEQEIKLSVEDNAHNETYEMIKVKVASTSYLVNMLPGETTIMAASSPENSKLVYENGEAKITDIPVNYYPSAAKIKFLFKGIVNSGNTYMVKITIKADNEGRWFGFRIGQSLNASPWYEEFTGFTYSYFQTTGEYVTYYHFFTADVEGPEPAMEFQYGNYKDQYPNGDIYIKEFGLYIISNENQVPTMTVDTTLPTILVKGASIDLSKYVKAHDVEDGDLTVKITGNVDTTTKGTYTVKFEAVDSSNAVVEEEITFTVLNAADTTAPVISIPDGFDIPEALLIDSYTTDGVKNAVMGAIIITDTCDGETYTIPAKDATWNWGGFDMSKVGKYALTVTVTDASGNKATLSKTVKVVKELTPNADTVIKDLMPDPNGNGNSIENVSVVANANETVISLTDTSSQWVSYNKIKYQVDGGFEVGKTFKVVLTVKADAPRKIQVQVKSHKDWSDYKNFVSEVIDLTTEYQTFEFTFEYDGLTTAGTQANYVDIEFQVGTDSDVFQGIDIANKIYLTKFEIVEPAPVKEIKKFDVLTNGKAYSDGSSVTYTTNEDGTLTWSTIYGKYFGWNTFKCTEGMNYFVFTIKVEEGKKFNFNYKVDADGNPYNGQQVNRVAEGEMTFVITLADITSNSTEFVKFCMWSYATTGTQVTITEAFFCDELPE